MTAQTMKTAARPSLLRSIFRFDAIGTAAIGLSMLVASGPLSAALGFPAPLLLAEGVILPLYAAVLWYAAGRPMMSRGLAWAAIALDALWVAGSAALLISGALPLTSLGWWATLILADLVAVIGVIKYVGLRRES